MAHRPSALSLENRYFCEQVAAFCEEWGISLRQLSLLGGGCDNAFSKTEADRLVKSRTSDAVVKRVRQFLADSFRDLLEKRGLNSDEIESELSKIFDPKEFLKMIANRCPLSPDAIRHFGLNRDPFDVDHLPTADEIYTNPELESVVGRLKDAVQYKRFVAVIGGIGTGKTLLKLRLAHELENERKNEVKFIYPEFFDMEEVTVHGIANRILAELNQKVPQNKEARVAKIREVLTQMQQESIDVALILDECHRHRDKVISSFKNFWEMTNGRSSRLLGVILFGQPSFVEARLREVKFKEISQRVQIIEMPVFSGSVSGSQISNPKSQIGPDPTSSAAYIAHRLTLAGGDISTLFEDKAIDRIAINATTPLAIGNLVNGALTAAYDLEEKQVTVSMPYFKNLSTGQSVLGIRRPAA